MPSVSWFKDGELLDVDSLDHVEIENDGQELTIYSAQVLVIYLYHYIIEKVRNTHTTSMFLYQN